MSEQLLARAVVALERIADVLTALTQAPPEPALVGCQHPVDRRVDFSAGPIDEWECKDCGFRFVGEPVEK